VKWKGAVNRIQQYAGSGSYTAIDSVDSQKLIAAKESVKYEE
jgi:hypothetical protein